MDNSSDADDEVTVPSGLVLDLVDECRHLGAVASPLLRMTRHLSRERPEVRCSIDLFNDAADWIERELGMTSIRLAGRQIGHRYYAVMRSQGLTEPPTTLALMRELEAASRVILVSPEGLGWDVIRHDQHSAVLRNTQDHNCVLGEGLLLSLMDRTQVTGTQVRQTACTRRGDDCCDYEITWSSAR